LQFIFYFWKSTNSSIQYVGFLCARCSSIYNNEQDNPGDFEHSVMSDTTGMFNTVEAHRSEPHLNKKSFLKKVRYAMKQKVFWKDNIDKPSANLTKGEKRPKLIKLLMKRDYYNKCQWNSEDL
jgi:hypothetical protein